MKVTVKEKSQEKEYPWIGISKVNRSIVYFTSDRTGICLDPGQTSNHIGEYSVCWCEYNFKTFEGEIVLSNS